MPTETQEKDIGGRKFTVAQLPGTRGLHAFNKCVRYLGPALVTGIRGVTKDGAEDIGSKDSTLLLSALETALPRLLADMSESQFDDLRTSLLATAQVDVEVEERGVTITKRYNVLEKFDLIFRGRVFDVYKLLFFAIQVNFGTFSTDGSNGLLAIAQGAASLFGSRPTSSKNGPSGVSGSEGSQP
jgi:hypothetical protein